MIQAKPKAVPRQPRQPKSAEKVKRAEFRGHGAHYKFLGAEGYETEDKLKPIQDGIWRAIGYLEGRVYYWNDVTEPLLQEEQALDGVGRIRFPNRGRGGGRR